MALAVETPARDDLSFRTNDDKRFGARWWKSDAATRVVVDSAVWTARFDDPEVVYDEDGFPLPLPPVETRTIDSTTPGDPNGWIDPDGFPNGDVLVNVPRGVWADLPPDVRAGTYDLVATGEGLTKCLTRGRFVVEEGISS